MQVGTVARRRGSGLQNKYVGDIGDFGKYGLLRHLCGELRLGIVWYLVRDQLANNDGRHIRYLNLEPDVCRHYDTTPCNPVQERKNRQMFRASDADLYDALRGILMDDARNVAAIEQRGILPSARAFVTDVVAADRAAWLEAALANTRECDVIFLDPDNGLEVPSRSRRSRHAGKYALYDEVRAFYARGETIVLYQHLDRTRDLVARCRTKVADALGCDAAGIYGLRYHRGTARIFFVIPAERHRAAIAARIGSFVASDWSQHFCLV